MQDRSYRYYTTRLITLTVNASDADVTLKSPDGVLFHVHRKNLEFCTESFPPGEISTEGEVVELTETAVTLELLLHALHLAEAAEKYQVSPAMNICHIRLRDMVHEHPVEVAAYAAKHDYPFLVSEVAPMMLSMPSVDVVVMLPPYLVMPSMRYIQEWTNVAKQTYVHVPYSPDGQDFTTQITTQIQHIWADVQNGANIALMSSAASYSARTFCSESTNLLISRTSGQACRVAVESNSRSGERVWRMESLKSQNLARSREFFLNINAEAAAIRLHKPLKIIGRSPL